MSDTAIFGAELFRVGLPPALMGLRWAVDLAFAREWLEASVRGAVAPMTAVDRLGDPVAARPDGRLTPAMTRGVAIIPIHGVITQRAGMCSLGCDQIAGALRMAMSDPAVGGILFDVDSPGGSTFGVDELAAEIMVAREVKPIVAVANSRMDSAAYWIASAASEISATPGGEVGSIGVYMVHRAEGDSAGVSVISAGKYKVEAHPFAPLSDEAKGALQARVDDDYGRFVARVAVGRKVSESAVRGGYGEGRALGAQRALDEGLVDRIETADSALARLAARVAGASVTAGAARADDNQEAERIAQARKLRMDLEWSYLGGRHESSD